MCLKTQNPQSKKANEAKGEGREAANQNEHSKKPKQTCEHAHSNTWFLQIKRAKKNITTPGKAQSIGEKLNLNEFKRNTKEGEQKKRKNGKTAEQKPKQENKQRKHQHYFHSQNRYKRWKNAGKTQNNREKIFFTENKISTNRKRRKWRQNGKTVTSGPTMLVPNTSPTEQANFSVSI